MYGVLDRYDQRPRAALVGEADAHLRCVLGQYDHDIGQRGDRCLLEQALLEAPVGVGLDAWHAPADYARDVHLWRRDIKPMLLAGTHLTEEFGAVSGAVDAAAKRFLDLGPGQQPSASYGPLLLGEEGEEGSGGMRAARRRAFAAATRTRRSAATRTRRGGRPH